MAAIRAIRDLETNRLLTSLRLLRSYFTNEQLQTRLLDYFDGKFSNLRVVGNGEGEELDVCWKTEFPAGTNDVHESILRHISIACVDHSVCYLDNHSFFWLTDDWNLNTILIHYLSSFFI